MKHSNRQGLPQQFVDFANSDPHKYEKDKYSATELLKPIREIVLNRKYMDKIEEDIADCIPALFGSAVHKLLEEYAPKKDGVFPEYEVEYDLGKSIVSGRIDLWDSTTNTIEDYKTCSVSKVVKGDFEDWRKQGLIYAWLLMKSSDKITRILRFYALMKDWSKIKSAGAPNYPQSAIYTWEYHISDSDYDYIESWLHQRLHDIYAAAEVLPECTDEDCWYTGTKYAVYKKEGDTKATKLCDTKEEALQYIEDKLKGVGIVDERPGEYLKCKYYCPCKVFCEGRKEE